MRERFESPVSLLENQTLVFNPGAPALRAHPLPCIQHSRRHTWEQQGSWHDGDEPKNRVFTHVYMATLHTCFCLWTMIWTV